MLKRFIKNLFRVNFTDPDGKKRVGIYNSKKGTVKDSSGTTHSTTNPNVKLNRVFKKKNPSK